MATGSLAQDVLLWRGWSPRSAAPLTFRLLEDEGVGGTDLQLLLHARYLQRKGHRVQVLGTGARDVEDGGVDFVGARDRAAQQAAIRSGRVRAPSLILLEGSHDAAVWFRNLWPLARIVHVGQNIDPGAHRQALAERHSIDVFGFVSVGHLAEYALRFPALRHQFMLLRNVVPWDELYRDLPAEQVRDRVVWVGGWGKKGLRVWSRVMARILRAFPSYSWSLCGPRYDTLDSSLPAHLFAGLDLPEQRVEVKSLPLRQLAREIAGARLVLVSLGNETASISTLDAHALGRPVISGNDMVYKFNNPEGSGLRVTTESEAHAAVSLLLSRPDLCDRLGAQGRELVQQQFTERHQAQDIEAILNYLELKPALGHSGATAGHSYAFDRAVDVRDKLFRKARLLSLRSPGRRVRIRSSKD